MTLALVCAGGALVATALALVRLAKGPHMADRIVALDIAFASTIVLTGAVAAATGRALFLDIGVGLAVVGFVATIVWARLIDASASDVSGPAHEEDQGPEAAP